MNLLPFWILVIFWCGSNFGSNFNYIMEPFWHHRGVQFWSHFGPTLFLNHRFMFWIHFAIILGMPKWANNRSKNRSPNLTKNRSPKMMRKNNPFQNPSTFRSARILVPPASRPPPFFCIFQWNGPPRSVNSASASRHPLTPSGGRACGSFLRNDAWITISLYTTCSYHVNI